jgi:hypothetical protein
MVQTEQVDVTTVFEMSVKDTSGLTGEGCWLRITREAVTGKNVYDVRFYAEGDKLERVAITEDAIYTIASRFLRDEVLPSF